MPHGDVMTDDNKQCVLSREARERLAQLERQYPDRPTERRIPERRKLEWREGEEGPEEDLHYRETDSMAARRLQAERDDMIEIVGTALGEAMADLRDEMDQQRKEAGAALSDEVRRLRTELCELSALLSELQRVLAAERAKVLDLPPLPSVRRVN
jgi:hypothetical protein